MLNASDKTCITPAESKHSSSPDPYDVVFTHPANLATYVLLAVVTNVPGNYLLAAIARSRQLNPLVGLTDSLFAWMACLIVVGNAVQLAFTMPRMTLGPLPIW